MGEICLSQELLDVHVLALEVPHAEAKDVRLASFVIEFRTAAIVQHCRGGWRGCSHQCNHENLWERSWSEIETRKEYLLPMTRIRIQFDGPDSPYTFPPRHLQRCKKIISRTNASHEWQVTKFLQLCVPDLVNTLETVK